MDCERCVTIHGPNQGCTASTTDAEGKAVCIFCADGSPCPVQYRILRGMRQSPVRTLTALVKQISENQEDRMTTTTTAKAETLPAPLRSCSEPGCKATLAPNNTSGKCQEHRSHSKSNGNGVVASHGNGVDPAHSAEIARGNIAQAQKHIAEERIGRLLADKAMRTKIFELIPDADKLKFVASWLAGAA
jgi:hypothetical protein